MLQIFINDRPAVIKNNSSFEVTFENPLFSDADSYSLNISFPLADCKLNSDIFGFLFLPGVDFKSEIFNVLIISGSTEISGAGIITGFNEVECKLQFLGNRSRENYYSDLDQIFVNTLDLGSVPYEYIWAKDVSVRTAWAGHDGNLQMVAIPWVNESTGNIQNDTVKGPGFSQNSWDDPDCQSWNPPEDAKDVDDYEMGLSWMPYLYDIAVRICNAIDFDFDFSFWRNSKWYHLLLCNAVPFTWNHDWNTLLPHWSVLEFFRNLEPLLEGYFNFDMIDSKVTFVPYADVLNDSKMVFVDNLIDSFSSDTFDDEQQCKLISQRFMAYPSSDSKTGKLYSCYWYVRDFCKPDSSGVISFNNANELFIKACDQNWRQYFSLDKFYPRKNIYAFYLEQEDRFVTDRISLDHYTEWDENFFVGLHEVSVVSRVPALLNNLGPRCVPQDRREADSPDLTLNVAPVVIDDTKFRRMPFISLGEFEDTHDEPLIEDYTEKRITTDIYDSIAMRLLESGEDDGSKAYFSTLYLGFYPGYSKCLRPFSVAFPPSRKEFRPEVFPIVDNFEIDLFWHPSYHDPEYTLSLYDSQGKFSGIPKVNPDIKYEFSFLADSIPEVNSIFIIRGKKYLCEKISATFSPNGMSQKLKGTFWLIKD